jgi:hypothetical protein
VKTLISGKGNFKSVLREIAVYNRYTFDSKKTPLAVQVIGEQALIHDRSGKVFICKHSEGGKVN